MLIFYSHVPHRVASVPSHFFPQKIMDQILQGLDDVICYLDDILIMGRDTEDHLRNSKKVLL